MHDWPETSESLIQRVRDPADALAWSAFLAIYRPVVFRLAVSRGLQSADAEDVAQRVFLSVARTVERWEPGPSSPPFRAWLSRIARNEVVKMLTRRKPDAASGTSSMQELLHQIPDEESAISKQWMLESRREAVRWAAAKIESEFTPVTWSMFRETVLENRPVREVAKQFGRSSGAVYIARCRVMQRLKEKVLEVSEMWSEQP